MPIEIVKKYDDFDAGPLKEKAEKEGDTVEEMVVCNRVEDVPTPNNNVSSIMTCAKCGARIWVSPTSPKKPPKYCWEPTFVVMEKLVFGEKQ